MYFWALVSALGTFWLGAGVSMRHSIEELITPTVALDKVCACRVFLCVCRAVVYDLPCIVQTSVERRLHPRLFYVVLWVPRTVAVPWCARDFIAMQTCTV